MTEQSTPTIQVRLFGALSVTYRTETGEWQEVQPEVWGSKLHSRRLLSFLVFHRRRASRGTLMEQLWPDSESSFLDNYLTQAVSRLRTVLRDEALLQINSKRTIYQLADQSLIWTDIDAYEAALQEAERSGVTSPEGCQFLEEAQAYAQRGRLLEANDDRWCHARRDQVETSLYRLHLWLAEAYEAQGRLKEAEKPLEALLQKDALDTTALSQLLNLLVKQGLTTEARRRARSAASFYQRQGVAFPSEIEALARRLQGPPEIQEKKFVTTTIPSKTLHTAGNSIFPEQAQLQISRANLSSVSSEILQGMMGDTASQYTGLSLRAMLDSVLIDRLEQAFTRPRTIDHTTLEYLNTLVFGQKQHLVQGGGTSWYDLLITASGHLHLFLHLLETCSGNIFQQLITSIGEICLLIGDVLFNSRDHHMATRYYMMSLRAAQEAQNRTLQAIAFGRYSLLLIDLQQSHQAFYFLDEAICLAEVSTSSLIRSWLWAVKSEAHSNEKEEKKCLQALDASQELLTQEDEKETCYTFVRELASSVYGAPKLLGYEGACYLHLQLSERAQQVLIASHQASSHPHHRSLVNADIALALVQQKAPQEACLFALQALTDAQQTHSRRAFQRILSVRQALNPWEELSATKDLDERLLSSRQFF